MEYRLDFFLRKKDNAEIQLKVERFYHPITRLTAAKERLLFSETENKTDESLLKKMKAALKETIEDYNKSHVSAIKELNDVKDFICRCQHPEILDNLFERAKNLQEEHKGYIEEIKEFQYELYAVTNLLDLYLENKEEWDLYYSYYEA